MEEEEGTETAITHSISIVAYSWTKKAGAAVDGCLCKKRRMEWNQSPLAFGNVVVRVVEDCDLPVVGHTEGG